MSKEAVLNAVEIEQAVSDLFEQPFDPEEFPYQFLEAFGNKATTIKKLRKGTTNKSDVAGGVLQRSHIHIAVCDPGTVHATMPALLESKATERWKAKFVLATDGHTVEAERLSDGEVILCDYGDFPSFFGYFLPLAGITKSQEIEENPVDVRATGRLNKLYIELLKENPNWGSPERRKDLNHFFARLIFCFFAEDTNIFHGEGLFTATAEQYSESDGSNTHEVISELFRAMNVHPEMREGQRFRPWADVFPYVNGGLFSDELDVPRFSKLARSFLISIGRLDWKQINPDIFGSMIQAVADDEERGELGMHYTSVPNILKVLNPLFLDDLREKLEEAGDGSTQGSKRKLLNLRNRIARIRVFDPACGSGNFLVIAYKHMRKIEFEINKRRGEEDNLSVIPLTNFRGIEIRHFAAEIARLALVIAEFQCDVEYLGEKQARLVFLPLEKANWITCGNALRIDWLSICPPTGERVKLYADDLYQTPLDQVEMDFENEGGETYLCGNPPYLGSTWQTASQKSDLKAVFGDRVKSWKSLDYVAGWFWKAAVFGRETTATAAFVATNSICQGQQVPLLWPVIGDIGQEIVFAHTSFKWKNLASHNANVIVVIVGISQGHTGKRRLFVGDESHDGITGRVVSNINPYLVPADDVIVYKRSTPLSGLPSMKFGNKAVDGGGLLLSLREFQELRIPEGIKRKLTRSICGSKEYNRGIPRFCLWIDDADLEQALQFADLEDRIKSVKQMRLASPDSGANKMADKPHQMREMYIGSSWTVVLPRSSSERREYLPAGLLDTNSTVTSEAFALFDAPLWSIALAASRIHLVWAGTVCGKFKNDYRYSNTLGWNTFPVPPLTEQNKNDLTHCAEEILLARESYWPATIADMYDPKRMDTEFPELRAAHERNDEVLERIYIGRRFKNDTERLEKLFEMYTKMIEKEGNAKRPAARKKKATS